jgi:hypothetical protein
MNSLESGKIISTYNWKWAKWELKALYGLANWSLQTYCLTQIRFPLQRETGQFCLLSLRDGTQLQARRVKCPFNWQCCVWRDASMACAVDSDQVNWSHFVCYRWRCRQGFSVDFDSLITYWRFILKLHTHKPSWEINNLSANEEILRLLWHPGVYYCIHNSPPFISIPIFMKPV